MHLFFKKSNFWVFFGIGASIRMGREIQYLPYAGFFDVVCKTAKTYTFYLIFTVFVKKKKSAYLYIIVHFFTQYFF